MHPTSPTRHDATAEKRWANNPRAAALLRSERGATLKSQPQVCTVPLCTVPHQWEDVRMRALRYVSYVYFQTLLPVLVLPLVYCTGPGPGTGPRHPLQNTLFFTAGSAPDLFQRQSTQPSRVAQRPCSWLRV